MARERALAGDGPTLLEAVTMRMHGHAAHDDMKYVPKEQVEEWRAKDPIDRQTRAPGGARRRRRGDPRRGQDRDRARRRGGAGRPDARRRDRDHRVFADEPALLEDGNAPWSGFAAKEA